MVISSVLWLLSGLATPAPTPVIAGALLSLTAIGVLRDWGLVKFTLPQNARLVPRSVLARHPLVAGYQFGFEMGSGVRTFLTATLPYVVALAIVLLAPSYLETVAAGVAFGLGRATMTWLRYASVDPHAWDRRMTERSLAVRRYGALIGGAAVTVLVAHELGFVGAT